MALYAGRVFATTDRAVEPEQNISRTIAIVPCAWLVMITTTTHNTLHNGAGKVSGLGC